MSFTTPASVPAGVSQRVLEVLGRYPESLADFDGDVSFVIDDDAHHLIQGSGRLGGDRVRFHEKDMAVNGKDVRLWDIRQEGEAFLAEQSPAF